MAVVVPRCLPSHPPMWEIRVYMKINLAKALTCDGAKDEFWLDVHLPLT